jgi:glycosyltransferase involved in cell wall biosynthesis
MPPSITLRSTCYNHERFVVSCLDSVKDQDTEDFEWIIIDDASTDRSRSLIEHWLSLHIEELREKRISVQFIAHEQNRGIAATFNELMERATGECLCTISCDDRLLPHRISSVRRIMSSLPEGYAGFYGDAYLIDAEGHRGMKGFIEKHQVLPQTPGDDLFEQLLQGNFIPSPSVAVWTKLLRDLGGYDATLPYGDYDLWLRMSRQYRHAFHREPAVEYRIHGDNFHLKFNRWREANYWIYRKHLDHPSGAKRFIGNLKGMVKHHEITDAIHSDVRGLRLNSLLGWQKLQAKILASSSAESD